jgi:hypothetical protein
MDVFLIAGGLVQNIIRVESVAKAQALFPGFMVVERTEHNQHLQIGDAWQ